MRNAELLAQRPGRDHSRASIRSTAGNGGRSSSAGRGRYRSFDDAISPCGKSRDRENPYCLHYDCRPRADRFCRQSEPPGRQSDRRDALSVEVGPKLLELLHEAVPTATAIALLIKPKNPMPRTRRRICGCCPQAGPACLCFECQYRSRFRSGLLKVAGARGGSTDDRPRCVL